MDNWEILNLWSEVLEDLKANEKRLTPKSFTTWIKDLNPVFVNEDEIVLEVKNKMQKEVVSDHYTDIIAEALFSVTHKEYIIHYTTREESKKNFPNSLKSNDIKTSNLNPKYVFSEFVVGKSNELPHAAALAVADSPAVSYNPLFIYGGVGLGKTHLMHAIGHRILAKNGQSKVFYVSSEKFTNELINSIKDDKNEAFRNKYRTVDVLLVDDIQFIAGKERTQEEFFHTFNALYEANKQIILSSDRPPKEIETLEDRLRSRFEMGLIADIQAPDYETRIAILRKKSERDKVDIPSEVFEYIATKIKSNIRELEGALNRVIAYSTLTKKNIDLTLANEALKDLFSASQVRKIDVDYIKSIVAEYYNVKIDDFDSKKRTRQIAYPRQIAMYISRELTDLSLPKIGEEFGGRDHTTVLHAYDKIQDEYNTNADFKQKIDDIIKELKGE